MNLHGVNVVAINEYWRKTRRRTQPARYEELTAIRRLEWLSNELDDYYVKLFTKLFKIIKRK